MAPNKSNSRHCFTHTCLPQALPAYTGALENSHTCFRKPTPSSSPTSNSHTSLNPPASPPFPHPRAGWTDSWVSNPKRAETRRAGRGPPSAVTLRRVGGKEAGKPRAPCAERTPLFRHPSPCIVRAGPGRSGPKHPAGPVRPPAGGLLPLRPLHTAPGASPCGARARGEGASAD